MNTVQISKPAAEDVLAKALEAGGINLSVYRSDKQQKPTDFNEFVGPNEPFVINDAVSRHLRQKMTLDEQFSMYKGLFVFFASNLNDVSACEAFSMLLKIIEEIGQKKYGVVISKEGKEKIDSKIKDLKEDLFYFLDEVFWCLPLYTPSEYEEKTNCEYFFVRENRLQKTKKAVWCFIGGIFSNYVNTRESISRWNQIDDNQLEAKKGFAKKALEFLCTSYEIDKFRIKASHIIGKEAEFRKRNNHGWSNFDIPKEDKDAILERVKTITPNFNLEIIAHCIEVFGPQMHKDFKKLFYHAHVRNGGEILITPVVTD